MDLRFIRSQVRAFEDLLIQWRRNLHRIPEVGLDLPETTGAVKAILAEMGVPLQEGYGGAGLVALIQGESGVGATVAIRADMDALDLDEEPGRDYGSSHPGRMHACGHDAHMAMALGAARFLAQNRQNWAGTVKFLFQPAEETVGGAMRMVDSGALENPRVDGIFALHIGDIWPEVGCGQIGVCYKPMMASADSFEFTITGSGGHGAAPHKSTDPVLASAQTITHIHSLISREVDPCEMAVITVGQVRGGTAGNIIPTAVRADGTVRTLDETVRGFLEERIGEIVAHCASASRCRHEYHYRRGNPVVENDPGMNDLVREAALDLLGPSAVCRIERPSLTGEDISYFLQEVPGCFFALGASNPKKGIRSLHHSPAFDIDESVLWRGSAVFCAAALRFLERKGA